MTEFVQELRHRCRNPKCRSKLPAPVSNEREAFCATGCHSSFYLHRCRVCEEAIKQPKRGVRLICKKSKCYAAWRQNVGFGRYHIASSAKIISETPDFIGSKQAIKPDRGIEWAIRVNSARIRGPRWVLEREFGRVPVQTEAG
jgi:hypothetical protein